MTITVLRQLACTIVIAVAFLAFNIDAHASDGTITFGFPTSDMSGLTVQTAPGIGGCIVGCASFRVASSVELPAKRQATLQVAAPAGTTIVGGTVGLRYRTKSTAISIHLQNRVNGRWFDSQRLRSNTATQKLAPIGIGGTAIAIALMVDAPITARAISADAENRVGVDSVSLTVRDLSTPIIGWATGEPGSGQWQRGVNCAAFLAQDVGLGVDHVEYAIGRAVASVTAPAGTRTQPRPLTFSGTACVDTTQLADGVYGATLGAVDANRNGNRSAPLNALVRVDNTSPTVAFVAPLDTEARQPQLQLQVSDRASGVATIAVNLDGVPLAVKLNGELADISPVASLADGLHRLSWTVVDGAGNSAQDAATFIVSDVTPPSIDQLAPVGLTTASTPISAHLSDTGSGLAVDSIHLAVDEADVTALVDVANGVLVYHPAHGWAGGEHRVRLTVGDHSGNRAVRTWIFQLPATTAPRPGDSNQNPTGGELTLNCPGKVVVRGATVSIHVTARRDHQPAPGERLQVRWQHGRPLAEVVTDEQGLAIIRLSAGTTDTLIVSAAGVQAKIVVTNGPSLSLSGEQRRVRQGGLLQLRGVLRGSNASSVRLEAKVARGWRLVTTIPVDPAGHFASPVRLPAVGTYVVRVRMGSTVSSPLRLFAQ